MQKKTLKKWLSSRVAVSVVNTLDNHKKRIVTIASLFGYLFDEHIRDKGLEVRLSKIMNLAENSSALTFPLIYHDLIWKEIEEQQLGGDLVSLKDNILKMKNDGIGQVDAKSLADLFVAVMPTYLFYDNKDVVKEDIIQLFESIKFIRGETTQLLT
jgi:hypothetical protein